MDTEQAQLAGRHAAHADFTRGKREGELEMRERCRAMLEYEAGVWTAMRREFLIINIKEKTLLEIKREAFRLLFDYYSGNVVQVCKHLDVGRSTYYREKRKSKLSSRASR